jgi:hypothetical protein
MAGRARAVASYAKRRKVAPVSREEEEIREDICAAEHRQPSGRRPRSVGSQSGGRGELRLATGEVYRLGENTLRRIA